MQSQDVTAFFGMLALCLTVGGASAQAADGATIVKANEQQKEMYTFVVEFLRSQPAVSAPYLPLQFMRTITFLPKELHLLKVSGIQWITKVVGELSEISTAYTLAEDGEMHEMTKVQQPPKFFTIAFDKTDDNFLVYAVHNVLQELQVDFDIGCNFEKMDPSFGKNIGDEQWDWNLHPHTQIAIGYPADVDGDQVEDKLLIAYKPGELTGELLPLEAAPAFFNWDVSVTQEYAENYAINGEEHYYLTRWVQGSQFVTSKVYYGDGGLEIEGLRYLYDNAKYLAEEIKAKNNNKEGIKAWVTTYAPNLNDISNLSTAVTVCFPVPQ